MKDFPNYLLNKKEINNNLNTNSNTHSIKNNLQILKDRQTNKAFQPSTVPSILKGLTREKRLDYTDIQSSLRLKSDEFLLFETIHHKIEKVNTSKNSQSTIKKTGLHRTFQELMIENEHNHFILTKGDTHER